MCGIEASECGMMSDITEQQVKAGQSPYNRLPWDCHCDDSSASSCSPYPHQQDSSNDHANKRD
jgi:hypothetical protein